ncbi:MAG: hypothetical protein K1X92_12140 [Bacteroidia bacterium]|nr:hypothetical protein [Bacteroidia bacterium]
MKTQSHTVAHNRTQSYAWKVMSGFLMLSIMIFQGCRPQNPVEIPNGQNRTAGNQGNVQALTTIASYVTVLNGRLKFENDTVRKF